MLILQVLHVGRCVAKVAATAGLARGSGSPFALAAGVCEVAQRSLIVARCCVRHDVPFFSLGKHKLGSRRTRAKFVPRPSSMNGPRGGRGILSLRPFQWRLQQNARGWLSQHTPFSILPIPCPLILGRILFTPAGHHLHPLSRKTKPSEFLHVARGRFVSFTHHQCGSPRNCHGAQTLVGIDLKVSHRGYRNAATQQQKTKCYRVPTLWA